MAGVGFSILISGGFASCVLRCRKGAIRAPPGETPQYTCGGAAPTVGRRPYKQARPAVELQLPLGGRIWVQGLVGVVAAAFRAKIRGFLGFDAGPDLTYEG